MRNVFTLVLLVGLALAGVAVYVVQNYIGSYQQALRTAQQQAQQQQTQVNMVEVYVATRDIRYGEDILTEDVRKVRWAADALPVGVFSTQNPLYKEGDKPRVALRAIDVNEPILMSKVTEPGVPAGLISQLEPGLRGYAISVNTITGVAGFLRPHDLIDIYWTSTPNVKDETDPNEKVFLITRLIASSVKIIAVDQNYLADENGAPRVASTLVIAVTAEQAAKLTLAQSTGNLSTTLVGLEDQKSDIVEVSEHSLLGIDREQQEAANAICSVKSRRGAEVIVTEIPCPQSN